MTAQTTYPFSSTMGEMQENKWNMFNKKWGSDQVVYYQRLTKASTYADTIGITVSFYGNECINPNMYPKDPSLQYPLESEKVSDKENLTWLLIDYHY